MWRVISVNERKASEGPQCEKVPHVRTIAYLLTFVGYGTWLHGDDRTSTDDEHNIYGTPKAEPNVVREHKHREDLPGEPVKFDAAMRGAIDEASAKSARIVAGFFMR